MGEQVKEAYAEMGDERIDEQRDRSDMAVASTVLQRRSSGVGKWIALLVLLAILVVAGWLAATRLPLFQAPGEGPLAPVARTPAPEQPAEPLAPAPERPDKPEPEPVDLQGGMQPGESSLAGTNATAGTAANASGAIEAGPPQPAAPEAAEPERPGLPEARNATEAPARAELPPDAAMEPAPPADVPPEQNATAATTSAHTVRINAEDSCWVGAVVDGKNREFFLRQGEQETLNFDEALVLKLGNAGGVRLRYDGEPFPTDFKLGRVETVRFPPGQ
jgi:cytoskeleton protein RodZ